ncbi:MAG TPA: ImmA/IrrE family metallo-endopeptidase [Rhizomicrobium sp.]|nr:ImmA/IrrE family metallo-endopeptidase [Rhizomicrobium sp.]
MSVQDNLAVVKKYWNTAPVDVYAIARELGLELNFIPLPQNVSGQIRRKDGGKFAIDVNSRHSTTRQRFTVAHELGHYIYHRELLGKGVGDTLAFRSEGTPLPNPHITVTHERQANSFAANLLMPNHLIEKLKAQGFTSPVQLAEQLGVSEEAMRIRLGLAPTRSLFDREDENAVEVRRGVG